MPGIEWLSTVEWSKGAAQVGWLRNSARALFRPLRTGLHTPGRCTAAEDLTAGGMSSTINNRPLKQAAAFYIGLGLRNVGLFSKKAV